MKAVGESVLKPIEYYENNVEGTKSLLSVMQKHDVFKLIFSSSATIYGNSEKKLIRENSKISPISTYGFNKVSIENMLRNLFESNPNKWRIANLRYFNPIGAHYTGMIGESPKGTPNNIFPLITKVASKKISKLKIYGENWDTNDGTCVRDFIHVMDLADGHILTMEYLLNNCPQILNLNLGKKNLENGKFLKPNMLLNMLFRNATNFFDIEFFKLCLKRGCPIILNNNAHKKLLIFIVLMTI